LFALSLHWLPLNVDELINAVVEEEFNGLFDPLQYLFWIDFSAPQLVPFKHRSLKKSIVLHDFFRGGSVNKTL